MFKKIFKSFANQLQHDYPELKVFFEEENDTGFMMYRRSQMMVDPHETNDDSVYISFHKDSDPKFVSFVTISISKFWKKLYISHNFAFREDGTLITYPVDIEDMPNGDDTIQ